MPESWTCKVTPEECVRNCVKFAFFWFWRLNWLWRANGQTGGEHNALGGIDAILSKAKRALREVIYERSGGGDDLGGYESPVDAMTWHFDQIYDHLIIVLEAAEMPEAMADLIAKWAEFKKQKGRPSSYRPIR